MTEPLTPTEQHVLELMDTVLRSHPASAEAAATEAPDLDDCLAAIERLGQYGAEAAVASEALAATMGHCAVSIRRWGLWAFGRVEQRTDVTLPVLRRALEDSAAEVRREAAEALGRLGAAALPALDALLRMMGDEDAAVRRYCVWSVGRLNADVERLLPALKVALDDTDPEVRREAVETLGHLGEAALAARERLEALALEGAHYRVAREAAELLDRLAPGWDAPETPADDEAPEASAPADDSHEELDGELAEETRAAEERGADTEAEAKLEAAAKAS